MPSRHRPSATTTDATHGCLVGQRTDSSLVLLLLAMTPLHLAVATQANTTHPVGVELWLTVRKAVARIDWFPVAVVQICQLHSLHATLPAA